MQKAVVVYTGSPGFTPAFAPVRVQGAGKETQSPALPEEQVLTKTETQQFVVYTGSLESPLLSLPSERRNPERRRSRRFPRVTPAFTPVRAQEPGKETQQF